MILDEPTAALGVGPTARVLATIRAVADSGTGVFVVSHDIETVFTIADRVVVLRHGSVVLDAPISEITRERLVHLMAGLGEASVDRSPMMTAAPRQMRERRRTGATLSRERPGRSFESRDPCRHSPAGHGD